MLKGMISIGIELATPVLKKFIKKVEPAQVTFLKPMIKIALKIMNGKSLAEKWRVEIIYELLPEILPKLLDMVSELKPYTEEINNYGREFRDVLPDIVSFGNEIINPIISKNEELANAFSKIEVPVKGNIEFKDMDIVIHGEVGKEIHGGLGRDPEADATLVLSTESLLELCEELRCGMASAVLRVLTEEPSFKNTAAIPKVRSLGTYLYSVIEDLLGIPIG